MVSNHLKGVKLQTGLLRFFCLNSVTNECQDISLVEVIGLVEVTENNKHTLDQVL